MTVDAVNAVAPAIDLVSANAMRHAHNSESPTSFAARSEGSAALITRNSTMPARNANVADVRRMTVCARGGRSTRSSAARTEVSLAPPPRESRFGRTRGAPASPSATG
eukprot:3973372-Prymnesium_polylepis.1